MNLQYSYELFYQLKTVKINDLHLIVCNFGHDHPNMLIFNANLLPNFTIIVSRWHNNLDISYKTCIFYNTLWHISMIMSRSQLKLKISPVALNHISQHPWISLTRSPQCVVCTSLFQKFIQFVCRYGENTYWPSDKLSRFNLRSLTDTFAQLLKHSLLKRGIPADWWWSWGSLKNHWSLFWALKVCPTSKAVRSCSLCRWWLIQERVRCVTLK